MKASVVKKSVLAVASLLTIASFNLTAKEQNFDRAQKEIKIMSKIFETSLAEQQSGKNHIISTKKPQATYLARQGMVFTFKFGRHSFGGAEDWEAFGEGIGHFVGSIASGVGAALGETIIAPDAPELSIDLEDSLDVYRDRMEALEQMREKQHEQRAEVRELQRQIRKMEREKNRVEEENEESNELRAELEEKVDMLKTRMKEYKKSMQEYRRKRDEKYTANSKLKAETIIATLCDYGSTLRSLKKDEYITLILSNFVDGKDQIYVFEYDDVRSCSSKDKLLKAAISYQI